MERELNNINGKLTKEKESHNINTLSFSIEIKSNQNQVHFYQWN